MFVVCGEALMDVFASGTTPSGLALDGRIGGSPFNVAMGLARLAQPVAFFGGLSTDFLGDRFRQSLSDEGIDPRCVFESSARTTVSFVGVDANGVPSYAFYGEGGADRVVPLHALDRIPADAKAFHFGSFSMVVKPVGDTQRALIEREKGRSLISWDPNVRLNVEPDVQVWRDTVEWMLPRTHLLKVSDEDLHLLYPGTDPAALAAQWLSRGVSLVVVTRGGKGASAWTRTFSVESPAVPTTLVDTVGAGDTFQAALLTWFAEHGVLSIDGVRGLSAASLEEALRFAGRAAAITCSRRGADLPRRSEVG
ncbi:MAG: carbohydrate kinase [Rhizobacter sp.]